MIFNVGPWQYVVKIVRDLRGDDGRQIMGRCDMDAMAIYISDIVAPHARLAVVLHEVKHAWSFHVPSPRNAEEDADLSATIGAAVHADLRGQGGIATLMSMNPPSDPSDPSQAK